MPDPLDRMLDSLAPDRPAPPPPAFIAAVARRRHRRRATQGTGALLVISAACGALLLRSPSPPPPLAPQIIQATHPIPDTSIAALARANRGRSADQLILPEPTGHSTPDDSLTLGARSDPAQVERWLNQ